MFRLLRADRSAVLAASDAPYGSLYHFFPGGKQRLGVAVIEEMGAAYRTLVERYFPPGADLIAATRAFFADGADLVEQTDYADACRIASIALEIASTNEPMRALTGAGQSVGMPSRLGRKAPMAGVLGMWSASTIPGGAAHTHGTALSARVPVASSPWNVRSRCRRPVRVHRP